MRLVAITAASILALASAPAFALGLGTASGGGGGSGSTSAFASSGGGSMSIAGLNSWSRSGSNQFAGAASSVGGTLTPPESPSTGGIYGFGNTSEANTAGNTYARSGGIFGGSSALGGAQAEASGGYMGGANFGWMSLFP